MPPFYSKISLNFDSKVGLFFSIGLNHLKWLPLSLRSRDAWHHGSPGLKDHIAHPHFLFLPPTGRPSKYWPISTFLNITQQKLVMQAMHCSDISCSVLCRLMKQFEFIRSNLHKAACEQTNSVTDCLVESRQLHLSAYLDNSVDKIFSDQSRMPFSLCRVASLRVIS